MGGLRCVVCGATFSDKNHNATWPYSPLTWRLPTCPRCGASYFEHVDIVTWRPERREGPEPDPALWEHAWGIPFSDRTYAVGCSPPLTSA